MVSHQMFSHYKSTFFAMTFLKFAVDVFISCICSATSVARFSICNNVVSLFLFTDRSVCCRVLRAGDFAMLLNAGMTAKQALVYNVVSSVLCVMGMCVGVAVANIGHATSWIFALIAGMFLYIALVDMVRHSMAYYQCYPNTRAR